MRTSPTEHTGLPGLAASAHICTVYEYVLNWYCDDLQHVIVVGGMGNLLAAVVHRSSILRYLRTHVLGHLLATAT